MLSEGDWLQGLVSNGLDFPNRKCLGPRHVTMFPLCSAVAAGCSGPMLNGLWSRLVGLEVTRF